MVLPDPASPRLSGAAPGNLNAGTRVGAMTVAGPDRAGRAASEQNGDSGTSASTRGTAMRGRLASPLAGLAVPGWPFWASPLRCRGIGASRPASVLTRRGWAPGEPPGQPVVHSAPLGAITEYIIRRGTWSCGWQARPPLAGRWLRRAWGTNPPRARQRGKMPAATHARLTAGEPADAADQPV